MEQIEIGLGARYKNYEGQIVAKNLEVKQLTKWLRE